VIRARFLIVPVAVMLACLPAVFLFGHMALAQSSSQTEATLCQGCDVPRDPVETSAPAAAAARQDAIGLLRAACAPLATAVPKPDSVQRLRSVAFGPKHGDGASQSRAKLAKMMRDLESLLVGLHRETKGCPAGCKRINKPEAILDTLPEANVASDKCPYKKYEPLRGVSAQAVRSADTSTQYSGTSLVRTFKGSDPSLCMAEASQWTESIAREQNRLGVYMAKNCPSPCSYANQTKFVFKKVSQGCELEVSFDLKCGPPRDSGFLESKASWAAKPAVKYKWTCEPN
jgi:hypothetical protein